MREINGVIKTAKRIVALPSKFRKLPLPQWPMLAQEAYLRGEKVWLIETAAPPGKSYRRCDFGLTPQQVLERTKRASETCIHRVVFVSAQKPYSAISPYGTEVNYKTALFAEIHQ